MNRTIRHGIATRAVLGSLTACMAHRLCVGGDTAREPPGRVGTGARRALAAGGRPRDRSGHGRDALLHGGVDLQAVGRGGAAKTAAGFNGRDAWLEVPAAQAPRLGREDFSIAVWLHTEETSTTCPATFSASTTGRAGAAFI